MNNQNINVQLLIWLILQLSIFILGIMYFFEIQFPTDHVLIYKVIYYYITCFDLSVEKIIHRF